MSNEQRDELAAIREASDDLTDLCPGYLRQSIRHVQRNCDIDCSVHEDDPDWDACKQPGRYDGERMANALAGIPKLLNAVDAVEATCRYLDTLADGDKHYAKIFRAAVTKALEEGEA